MPEALPDAAARARALDPASSFIVQAPAGSGKTGLLIQRVLTLLAAVDAPEEVIAITFTRKAAGEMLRRLVDALAEARADTPPRDAHAAHTRALAQGVLDRDLERGWHLTDNPARLKVYTFDAFCQHLARRMPFLTGLGGDLGVADPAGELYAEAAARVLDRLDDAGPVGTAARRLLAHQDNDRARAEGLLAAMLARRDQWLSHVAGRDAAAFARDVEAAVGRMVADELGLLARHMAPVLDEAMALARHAAANLPPEHRVQALAAAPRPPTANPADLAAWQALAALLLTAGDELRSSGGVNKKIGFPPGGGTNGAMKQRMQALLDGLAATPAAEALAGARALPDPERTPDWHALLEAVGTCLVAAVAHLTLVFRDRRRVDYTQVALGASEALGAEGHPTELALILDYRIRHLLVDEFQDTSRRQFDLVERLTTGWTPGDGHSLFLVGDPMQSIYGFRDAEVGLYLKAWEEGIGDLPLTPLVLSANFRSAPAVVDWVNGAFPAIFPAEPDLARGAVPYAPGRAAGDAGGEVTFDPVAGRDDAAEAGRAVERVRAARAADPEGSVAVLVRGRPHLHAILPALRAEFRVDAVEIAPLGRTPVIVDLMTVCRALVHPADRVAWLGLLRAPWCGLRLADLHALAADAPGRTVADLIADPERAARLAPEAQVRLARVRAALAAAGPALEAPLADRVEAAWVSLGGPAAVGAEADLRHAERLLTLVADLEAEGGSFSIARLEARVEALFAETDGAPEVEVMTIHRAKGLEWDTVVLPGLGRGGGQEDPPLLRWLERQRAGAGAASDLLLAPAPERGDGGGDRLYDLLGRIARDRRRAEEARLLYVAATRARKRLHMIGQGRPLKSGGYSYQAGSLLGYLWDTVEPAFRQLPAPAPAAAPEAPVWGLPDPLRRLPADWAPPEPAPAVTGANLPPPVPEVQPEYSWAGEVARAAGSVAHRALEWLAREGAEGWDRTKVRAAAPRLRAALAAMGMADDDAAAAAARVEAALVTMLDDPRGRWLLGARPEGATELAVAGVVDGRVAHRTMDRTFVEDGIRWIVDYKTGRHEGADLAHFLDEEQRRYRPQLEAYARLMSALEGDGRPIRLGLYFPAHGAWREWAYEAGEAVTA